MNDGQENAASTAKSTRRSTRFVELLNSPSPRKTPLGVDTAWALKLKDAVNAAVRELHVQVLSAKPICNDDDTGDSGIMRFELETDRGPILAIRSREGAYSFEWK
jgi:hypothetical protein